MELTTRVNRRFTRGVAALTLFLILGIHPDDRAAHGSLIGIDVAPTASRQADPTPVDPHSPRGPWNDHLGCPGDLAGWDSHSKREPGTPPATLVTTLSAGSRTDGQPAYPTIQTQPPDPPIEARGKPPKFS